MPKTSNKSKPTPRSLVPYSVGSTGTDLVDWESFMTERTARARENTKHLPTTGGKGLGFRGGVITMGTQQIGNEMECIILGWIPERGWYDRPYDAMNKSPPSCYSYDSIKPHPDANDPQNPTCNGCQMDAFGSAEGASRGKACKQGARLAVIPADLKTYDEADIYTAHVSTMNAKAFKDYEDSLAQHDKAISMVVTKLTCRPDPATQYALGFKALRDVNLPKKVAASYMGLLKKADVLLLTPYPPMREDRDAKPKGSAKGSVKGSVKGSAKPEGFRRSRM